ncbi:MAG: hypothetical protein AAGA15_12410 [Pseudomonadota bacterium]
MGVSQRDQKRAWEARIARIQTGRTMTQVAEAEGTVPIQFSKRRNRGPQGLNGILAWFMGGTLGWMAGTVLSVSSPATKITEQYDLEKMAPLIESYGNPLAALAIFMLVMSLLRVNGFIAKLFGLTTMAWVFALQAGMDVPTVGQLIDAGEAMLAGNALLQEQLATIREWASSSSA